MIDRTYKCDLCSTRYDPNTAHGLYGVYWSAGEKMVRKSCRESEHHMCFDCIQGLALIATEIGASPSSASAEGK